MKSKGDFMDLKKEDLKLMDLATKVAKDNSNLYIPISLHVGCVIKAKSGKIYKGINIKTSHSVCAEQVALGQALACGEREFDTIVSVKLDENGQPRVVSPCGLCRYIFDKMALDMFVIVEDIEHNKVVKVKTTELLPYPYKRNRDDLFYQN